MAETSEPYSTARRDVTDECQADLHWLQLPDTSWIANIAPPWQRRIRRPLPLHQCVAQGHVRLSLGRSRQRSEMADLRAPAHPGSTAVKRAESARDEQTGISMLVTFRDRNPWIRAVSAGT